MGSRQRRARRGQPSILERGWVETDPSGRGNDLTWAVGSPIGDFLTYIGIGLSQREACVQAGVNRSTVQGLLEAARTWTPTDPHPAAIRAVRRDDDDGHSMRLAAFAIRYEQARARPKVVALTSIQTAAPQDWRAAESLLRLLYRDEFSSRLEVTGEGGGPVEVDAERVAARLGEILRNLVDDADEVNLEPEVNPEEREVAPVRFPADEALEA